MNATQYSWENKIHGNQTTNLYYGGTRGTPSHHPFRTMGFSRTKTIQLWGYPPIDGNPSSFPVGLASGRQPLGIFGPSQVPLPPGRCFPHEFHPKMLGFRGFHTPNTDETYGKWWDILGDHKFHCEIILYTLKIYIYIYGKHVEHLLIWFNMCVRPVPIRY